MKKIKGDLLKLGKEGKFDVIVHGCNCQGDMGAGIAAQIKKQFPQAAQIDLPDAMPGTIAHVRVKDLVIVNAYTQIHYDGKPHPTYGIVQNKIERVNDTELNRYEFIRSAMHQIKISFGGKKIGVPMIGAGLAGGDWNVIEKIIEEELGEDVTVVVFDPKS